VRRNWNEHSPSRCKPTFCCTLILQLQTNREIPYSQTIARSLRRWECYTYVIWEQTFSHVRQSSKQLWRWNLPVSGTSYIILWSLV
jgi:hypothetical protein